MLPRITENVDKALKQELLSYVDQVVRNDEDIEKALDVVDQRLLVDKLGISTDMCKQCREVWKKLQNRRLTRGE